MIDGKILIEKLLAYASAHLGMNARDEVYFRNLLLREFKLDEPSAQKPDYSAIAGFDVPDTLVSDIEQYAVENGLAIEENKNLFSTYVMGLLSPLPSVVNWEFLRIKSEQGIERACKYLHDLSIKNNYVQKTAIGRNLKWKYTDGDKYLEITVNLSKPEKDNKETAKLLTKPKTTKYPACMICKENEGFQGTLTHPARENLRTVSLSLDGEKWFVQYSPYAYFNEHLIAISENHTPMHVASDTVRKLLDFVDFFPNYMIDSNASLPIIGGSILNHEHYQGGGHVMPMHNAPIKQEFNAERCPEVKIGIVDWYNSVIRLESKNRDQITELATDIVNCWAMYSDIENGIYAKTGEVQHNAVAPVCRKVNDGYVFDLILRNNITSEEYPDGVFHAHPEYHNIKKESIGLIEAMGLFILPGRLKKQIGMIAEILSGKVVYDYNALSDKENYLNAHKEMIKEMIEQGLSDSLEDAENRIIDRINHTCKNILDNTAVFKNNQLGKVGFERFLNACGVIKLC